MYIHTNLFRIHHILILAKTLRLLIPLHQSHKFNDIIGVHRRQFHGRKMSTRPVVRTLHQHRIFVAQPPVHCVHHVLAEASVRRGHVGRNAGQSVGSFFGGESAAVQSARCRNRSAQIVHHNSIDYCVLEGVVKLRPSAVDEFAVLGISPCAELFE